MPFGLLIRFLHYPFVGGAFRGPDEAGRRRLHDPREGPTPEAASAAGRQDDHEANQEDEEEGKVKNEFVNCGMLLAIKFYWMMGMIVPYLELGGIVLFPNVSFLGLSRYRNQFHLPTNSQTFAALHCSLQNEC